MKELYFISLWAGACFFLGGGSYFGDRTELLNSFPPTGPWIITQQGLQVLSSEDVQTGQGGRVQNQILEEHRAGNSARFSIQKRVLGTETDLTGSSEVQFSLMPQFLLLGQKIGLTPKKQQCSRAMETSGKWAPGSHTRLRSVTPLPGGFG